MANLNGADIKPTPGTLSFGSNEIGFVEDGVRLIVRNTNQPILPEQLGNTPIDYILLGGATLATFECMQYDEETMDALAGYAAAVTTLTLTTDDIGKKLSDLFTPKALTFTPASADHPRWTAARCVPLLAEVDDFELHNQSKKETIFQCAIACLPPAAGGTIVTILPQP